MSRANKTLVYGVHSVAAVIETAPERVLEIWASHSASRLEVLQSAVQAGLRVHSATNDSLTKLVGGGAHQGIVAAVRPLPFLDESGLLGALSNPAPDAAAQTPLLLVLDGVTDPHNLGACLRTADAAGVFAVVLPHDRAARVDGVVRKVAAGAAETVRVATVTNLARTLNRLKEERSIWVVGTDGQAAQTVYEVDLNRPLALVLGAEGSGMRRLTRECCDYTARIPMAGRVQSLNVSVAAGVALFEARRQRGSASTTIVAAERG